MPEERARGRMKLMLAVGFLALCVLLSSCNAREPVGDPVDAVGFNESEVSELLELSHELGFCQADLAWIEQRADLSALLRDDTRAELLDRALDCERVVGELESVYYGDVRVQRLSWWRDERASWSVVHDRIGRVERGLSS